MKEQLKFIKYLIFHPVDGFWQMQREGKGKLWICFVFISLWILNNIISRQGTGFLFNFNYTPINVFSEIRNVLILVVLFTVSNWAVTTLIDGESTIKDIFMMFSYSMIPIFLIGIPVTIYSNFATYSEAVYITMLNNVAMFLFGFLVFIGILTINQYNIRKTILISFITLVTAGIIVFVFILFFSILSQLTGFVMAMYKEINLRL